MKNLMLAAIALPMLASCTGPGNEMNEIDRKVEALLGQMTLEEKLGQMNQINPWAGVDGTSPDVKMGKIGSILNMVNPVEINQLQKVAVEESRLGIPILFSRDVIHGYKTIFPIPLGQAASFNPEVVEQGARISAIEATAAGIRWTFSPMIDIARDPRWGRIAEGSGEDTYLTSVMGAAMVKGYQGDGPGDPTSMAACAKHFVGYGASESGRDYNSTYITERQLRNTYLPPFEAAAKAGSYTFMSSFNDNDGVPASGNDFVMRTVLRNEWGFDGFVVSDWASVGEMISHGFCVDDKDAAQKGINAGVDMEMVSGMYLKNGADLLKESKVTQKTIDDAVRNILRIKYKLDLFDHPYVDESLSAKVEYHADHLKAAKQSAVESVVLLKNDNQTLPVKETVKTILVTGPLADAPYEQMGTWVFDGDKARVITPLAALREQYGDRVRIVYEPALAYSRDKDNTNIAKAVSAARQADVVLAFVGEESILSGEAHCLADLNLQGAQQELISALAKTNKPLVTVFMAGRPLTIGRELELSDAVMYAWHPGTMGGPALADLIFGVEVPSGKLPVTFPRMVGQIPVYYNRNMTGRPAQGNETLLHDIPVEAGQTSLGCTSFWMDAGLDELLPFGYGLSYTDFDYSNLKIEKSELNTADDVVVTFDLANTGNYKATEVVQLYIRDMVGSVTRPVKELKGFQRVTLEPGKTQQVRFTLPVSELAFWNIDMKKVVEPGEFTLWVGPDSKRGIDTKFTVL